MIRPSWLRHQKRGFGCLVGLPLFLFGFWALVAWLLSFGIPLFRLADPDRQLPDWLPLSELSLTLLLLVYAGLAAILSVAAFLRAQDRDEDALDLKPYCPRCGDDLLGCYPMEYACHHCGRPNDTVLSGRRPTNTRRGLVILLVAPALAAWHTAVAYGLEALLP